MLKSNPRYNKFYPVPSSLILQPRSHCVPINMTEVIPQAAPNMDRPSQREAQVRAALRGPGLSALGSSLSGLQMGVLRKICFRFVVYDLAQFTWKDST